MSNEKFRNALARRPQAVPPIWLMRQAGRYHAHYQALRREHSFMDLCKKPELAAAVALGPIQDFDFDIAILFSDLLFPLAALGMGLEYKETGPELGWQLRADNIRNLRSIENALPELAFQGEAVRATREVLPSDKSLIGFVGGPFTLFAYAVEGSHKGSLPELKRNLGLFPHFCETMVPLLRENIRLQLENGAEVVMLFDTAAGELAPHLYEALVVPGITELARNFPGKLGYYAKTTVPAHHRHSVFSSGLLAGLGVDHRWDMRDAFALSRTGFVQGNFDQSLLALVPADFARALDAYLAPLAALAPEARAGWVAGLGHGVIPQANPENVRAFVRTVRERFHG